MAPGSRGGARVAGNISRVNPTAAMTDGSEADHPGGKMFYKPRALSRQ